MPHAIVAGGNHNATARPGFAKFTDSNLFIPFTERKLKWLDDVMGKAEGGVT